MIAPTFIFLTINEVLLLHELQLERYGGAAGIRDNSLLDSAINMPQASFDGTYVHDDIYTMAAAYAFHIAENQPFVEIEDPSELLYDAMINIAQKKLNKAGLANLLRQLTVSH